MDDFIKNNTDLIKSFINLVVAFIPLIIIVITFLTSRVSNTKEPLDSPSLKVFSIMRFPVDDFVWEKRKLRLIIFALSTGVLSIFIYPFLMNLFFSQTGLYRSSIFEIFEFISGFLYGALTFYIIFKLPKNARDARYKFFKNAEIIIEANHHYLFNKCHATLRRMKLNVVEINESKGKLEAFQTRIWPIFSIIQVQIEQIENSKSSYIVSLKFEKYRSEKIDLAKSSKVINRFINILISKLKDTNENSKSSINISTEGEG